MGLTTRFQDVFGRTDAFLAACGLIGILLFLFASPQQSPDAAASEHISREDAIEAARAFAESASRVSLDEAASHAVIQRRPQLLDSLQLRLGRPDALRYIRENEIPAYYWEVSWSEEGELDAEPTVRALLTLAGEPLGITAAADAVTLELRHDEALAALQLEGALPDSLPLEPLAFRLDEEDAQAGILTRSGAVRLARYHVGQTALADRELRVDSVFASGEDGVVTATVRLSSADPGQWFTADVELLPTGALVGLEPSFVREDADEGILSSDEVLDIAKLLLYALLGLILVVVFFRRINARLIDTRAAARDALLGGLTAGIAMSAEITSSTSAPTTTIEIAFIIVGVVMMSFAAGAFVFFISGAATSLARDRWDEKLRSLDLARRLFIRNVPVGTSVVRGVMGGLALLGLAVAALIVVPGLAVHYADSQALFATSSPAFSVLRAVCGNFFFALYVSFAAVLGVGALMHLRANTATAATIGIVLALAFLHIAPFELRPFYAQIVLSGIMGCVVAWLLWRFDILSVMTTLFVLALTAAALGGWSVAGTPEHLSAIMILLVVAVVLVIGLAGALSGKTSQEVPVIIPEYIEELAQRERLKRELELAREVQLSFLPPGNPDWPGLEIASICLPAHEVGGDYYDFFRIDDDRLALVVGDVSGKGMQAAFYMTLMKGVLQSMVSDARGPAAILARSNELFRMNAPRGTFMSMVLGIFDMRNNTWTFARAGHNPVLVHRQTNDRPEVIKPNGAAIGLASNTMFSGSIEERTVMLSKGDLVLIYTDGVTEAMNERRDLYDEHRLEGVISRVYGRSAGEVIDAVVKDVEKFSGKAPRHDDMTMVAVRVTAETPISAMQAHQTAATE